MKGHPAWRGALRSLVTANGKEFLEVVAWGVLALLALTLVTLPGDQTAAAVDWLFKRIEAGS